MSYFFNDLMSIQLKLIDEKVQHDGLILLVFVSKNVKVVHYLLFLNTPGLHQVWIIGWP